MVTSIFGNKFNEPLLAAMAQDVDLHTVGVQVDCAGFPVNLKYNRLRETRQLAFFSICRLTSIFFNQFPLSEKTARLPESV